jgi:hypothetical protein
MNSSASFPIDQGAADVIRFAGNMRAPLCQKMLARFTGVGKTLPEASNKW